MKIELIEIPEREKLVVRQLLGLYTYDFSEHDGADVDEHGYYGHKYLDHYWTETAREPLIIKVARKLAGVDFTSIG